MHAKAAFQLHAPVAAMEESLSAERARVKRLEREFVSVVEKMQKILSDHWKTRDPVIRQLAEDGEPLQDY